MLHFELPLVTGKLTIDDALAETIESSTSGLVFERNPGNYRLVHFDKLVEASNEGKTLLDQVDWEPLITIESSQSHKSENLVRTAGLKFGFVGTAGPHIARLFSISESFGIPYTIGSSGTRCQRPNKPASVSPRDWFHYYPPNALDVQNPNICRICGAPM